MEENVNGITFKGRAHFTYWDSIEKYFIGLKDEGKETYEVRYKTEN